MRLLTLVRLTSLRAMRRHPLRAVLAALTVAAGVAVVVAILVNVRSVDRAIDEFGTALAGPAPLRVAGPVTRGGIEAEVVDQVAALDDVDAAIGMTRAITEIRDPGGTDHTVLAFGVDCEAERLVGEFGCAEVTEAAQVSDGATAVVLSERLASELGDGASLGTNAGQIDLDGALTSATLDIVNEGRTAFLPLPIADGHFLRHGALDLVYIFPVDGADLDVVRAAVRDAIGSQYELLEAGEPPAGFDPNTVLIALLALMALFSLSVGGLLVYQVASLSLAERRRDLAVTGALGAGPGMIRGTFLLESAVLGLIGAVLGAGLGVLLAIPLVQTASESTERFLGITVPTALDAVPFVVGALVGIAVAVFAALPPAVKAGRLELAAELSGREADAVAGHAAAWRRGLVPAVIGGLGVLATVIGGAGGGLDPWQPPVMRIGLVLAIAALILAAGRLAAPLVTMPPARRWALRGRSQKAAGRLGVLDLASDPARAASIGVAVATPVAIATVLSSLLIAIEDESIAYADRTADDRAVVTTTAFTDVGALEAKPDPELVAALEALDEVGAVERFAEIELGARSDEMIYIQAADAPKASYEGLVGDDPLEVLERGEVVIGGTLARDLGVEPGDSIDLPTSDGHVQFAIGAVWAEPQGAGRTVNVRLDLAEDAWGPQPPGLLYVVPAEGITMDALVAAIEDAQLDPALAVRSPAGFGDEVGGEIAELLGPIQALQAGLLIAAFTAVVSTLLLVGVRRRKELAVMGAVGATPPTLLRSTVLQAVICAAAGAVLGVVVSVGMLEALRNLSVIDVGIAPPFRFAGGTAVIYAFAAIAVAAIGAVLPGRRAGQVPLALALRDE